MIAPAEPHLVPPQVKAFHRRNGTSRVFVVFELHKPERAPRGNADLLPPEKRGWGEGRRGAGKRGISACTSHADASKHQRRRHDNDRNRITSNSQPQRKNKLHARTHAHTKIQVFLTPDRGPTARNITSSWLVVTSPDLRFPTNTVVLLGSTGWAKRWEVEGSEKTEGRRSRRRISSCRNHKGYAKQENKSCPGRCTRAQGERRSKSRRRI